MGTYGEAYKKIIYDYNQEVIAIASSFCFSSSIGHLLNVRNFGHDQYESYMYSGNVTEIKILKMYMYSITCSLLLLTQPATLKVEMFIYDLHISASEVVHLLSYMHFNMIFFVVKILKSYFTRNFSFTIKLS